MNKRYMDFVPDDSAKKKKTMGNTTRRATTKASRQEEMPVRAVRRSASSTSSAPRRSASVRHVAGQTAVRSTGRSAVRSAGRSTSQSGARTSSQSGARIASRTTARVSARSAARPTGVRAIPANDLPVEEHISRRSPKPEPEDEFDLLDDLEPVSKRKVERDTTQGMNRNAYVPPTTERVTRGRRPAKNEQVGFGVIEEVEPMDGSEKIERKPLTDKTMTIPRSPFINQNRVEKRPLSKNVYRKEPSPAPKKEEAVGPVTIIAKPEKEKHVGLVITIILTIILGAAAGTVAFLLLPK